MLDVATIVDMIISIHVTHIPDPIPSRLGMFVVRVVVSVSSKSSGDIEEAAIGDGVLVIVASEIWVDLPPQSGLVSPYLPQIQCKKAATHPPPQRSSGLLAWVLKTA